MVGEEGKGGSSGGFGEGASAQVNAGSASSGVYIHFMVMACQLTALMLPSALLLKRLPSALVKAIMLPLTDKLSHGYL